MQASTSIIYIHIAYTDGFPLGEATEENDTDV